MAHVEAQCLPFGPKWVLKKKEKCLEIKCKPHNGSSGGAMPTFWPSMGVKVKSKKGNPNYYNIRFLCKFTRMPPKRL
jgi:hypothetical protein